MKKVNLTFMGCSNNLLVDSLAAFLQFYAQSGSISFSFSPNFLPLVLWLNSASSTNCSGNNQYSDRAIAILQYYSKCQSF